MPHSINTMEVDRASTRVETECDDDRVLREMGYRHELSRGFTQLSSFSFCYTSVAVLASLSMLYSYGLSTGGPAVMVWGWVSTPEKDCRPLPWPHKIHE